MMAYLHMIKPIYRYTVYCYRYTEIMKQLAIFASGRGSNAQKIVEYFQDIEDVNVQLIISNKASAAVLDMANENGISTLVIKRKQFYETQNLLNELANFQIDFIVLAGFLWLIPPYLVETFPQKIVNIHPALLPKYGGKGMYGMNIHRAVHAAKEAVSGITIHYVNEQYDEGDIIFQAECPLNIADNPENIAKKVLILEHHHFSRVIHEILT